MRGGPWSSPIDVSPEGVDVRTRVHEYGGGAWCVRRARLLRRCGRPPVAPRPTCRRGADHARLRRAPPLRRRATHRRRHSLIGVRERHDRSGRVADVVNELVAVPVNGAGDPSIIAEGRDFTRTLASPATAGGCAWLAWDLPWMPWDGCELFVADLNADGSLANERHVVGRDGEESIWQPAWGPNGDLVFASDRSGWWNLERLRGHDRSVLHPMEAEFGYPQWVFGGSSFAILPDGRIARWYGDWGVHLALLDRRAASCSTSTCRISFEHGPAISAGGDAIVIAGARHAVAGRLGRPRLPGRRGAPRERGGALDAADVSVPASDRVPDRAWAHGVRSYLYPPTNHGFAGPDGQRPPLIVHEPWRPDERGDRHARSRHPVLDHPSSPWST